MEAARDAEADRGVACLGGALAVHHQTLGGVQALERAGPPVVEDLLARWESSEEPALSAAL